jgi:hypothetical protein
MENELTPDNVKNLKLQWSLNASVMAFKVELQGDKPVLTLTLPRNPKQFSIQIVSPSDGTDHWGEFCYGIGRGCSRICVRFEDWALQHAGQA